MGVLLNHAVDLAQLNSCICYSIFSEATDNISQSKFIIFPNMNSYLISHLFYMYLCVGVDCDFIHHWQGVWLLGECRKWKGWAGVPEPGLYVGKLLASPSWSYPFVIHCPSSVYPSSIVCNVRYPIQRLNLIISLYTIASTTATAASTAAVTVIMTSHQQP